MFTQFMNQIFTLKVVDGTDENGMPDIIETIPNIACRITYKNKLIVAATGQQITSEGSILSSHSAKPGDIVVIDEKEKAVLSAAPMYDFANVLHGYKIYF